MVRFEDEKGRQWDVTLNVSQLKVVRNRLGYDIGKLTDDEATGLVEIISDPVKLCDTLFVLCERQAKERGVTDEDFGAALAGDAIVRAQETLIEEFANFSPSQVRATIRDLAAKAKRVSQKQWEMIQAGIDSTDEKLLTSLKLAIDSPGLSGSIPGGSPSGN